MIPHPSIPNFYIIPDYIEFQSIFFNAHKPIPRNCVQFCEINDLHEDRINIVQKDEQVKSTMLKTEK